MNCGPTGYLLVYQWLSANDTVGLAVGSCRIPKKKNSPNGLFFFFAILLFSIFPGLSCPANLVGDIAQLSASCGRCSETEQLKHRELKAGALARNDLVRRAGNDS